MKKKYVGTLIQRNQRWYWRHKQGANYTNTALMDEQGNVPQTKADAEALAAEHSASLVAANMIQSKAQMLVTIAETKGLLAQCQQIKIADVWQTYLDSPARPDSSASTLNFYQKAIVPFVGWVQACHSECKSLQHLTENLADQYAMILWKQGISERTFNARIGALKLIFRVLLKEENPFAHIAHKTERQQSRNAFTIEQLQAIARTLDSADYYMLNKSEMRTMLLLMLYTGCRGEDAALMKWVSINFTENTITYIPRKTARKRPISVAVPMAFLLREVLLKLPRKNEFILPAVALRYRRNPCGISTDITKLLEASGIQTKETDSELRRKRPIVKYSMHSFRHTFCTLAVNANVPITTIQAIVGHSTAAMTAHYSHIGLASKDTAIKAISAWSSVDVEPHLQITPVLTSLRVPENLTEWLENNLSTVQKQGILQLLRR